MNLLKKSNAMTLLGMLLIIACGLGAGPATSPATSPSADPPTAIPATANPPTANLNARELVSKILSDVTDLLKNKNLSKGECNQKVREIAYANIDFETLSKLTLAQNWRNLSAKQQSDFVTEFRKHLSATYSHITDDYDNQDLTVTGDHKESNGDWTVQTQIVGHKTGDPKRDVTKVDYRLRQKDGQWKIIDVTVENVSLVANFRSQFQDIISKNGIDHLMQLLRDKNAKETN